MKEEERRDPVSGGARERASTTEKRPEENKDGSSPSAMPNPDKGEGLTDPNATLALLLVAKNAHIEFATTSEGSKGDDFVSPTRDKAMKPYRSFPGKSTLLVT